MKDIKSLSFEDYSKMSESEKKDLKLQLEENTKRLKKLEEMYKNEEIKRNLTEQEIELQNKVLEFEKDISFIFRNYENFSVFNYKNLFRPYTLNKKACIALFLDEDISEIEEYGLISLVIDSFQSNKDFDIHINLYYGTYSEYYDRVTPSIKNNRIYTDYIHNVSKKAERYSYLNIKDNMKVYYFYIEQESRMNKSMLWKATNPRKFTVKNKCKH